MYKDECRIDGPGESENIIHTRTAIGRCNNNVYYFPCYYVSPLYPAYTRKTWEETTKCRWYYYNIYIYIMCIRIVVVVMTATLDDIIRRRHGGERRKEDFIIRPGPLFRTPRPINLTTCDHAVLPETFSHKSQGWTPAVDRRRRLPAPFFGAPYARDRPPSYNCTFRNTS